MGTAINNGLPVKPFILNNERLGMVVQWQELRMASVIPKKLVESLPDFVKLAEAFGARVSNLFPTDDLARMPSWRC